MKLNELFMQILSSLAVAMIGRGVTIAANISATVNRLEYKMTDTNGRLDRMDEKNEDRFQNHEERIRVFENVKHTKGAKSNGRN